MASRSTKLLRVIKSDEPGFEASFAAVCERLEESLASEKDVRRTIERVREGGDAELVALVQKADRSKLESLEVGRDEWDDACEQADAGDRAALGKAAMRVREFHRKRIPSSWEMREEGGGYMGHRVRAARAGGRVRGQQQPACALARHHEHRAGLRGGGAGDRPGRGGRPRRQGGPGDPDGRPGGRGAPGLQDGRRACDRGPGLRDGQHSRAWTRSWEAASPRWCAPCAPSPSGSP